MITKMLYLLAMKWLGWRSRRHTIINPETVQYLNRLGFKVLDLDPERPAYLFVVLEEPGWLFWQKPRVRINVTNVNVMLHANGVTNWSVLLSSSGHCNAEKDVVREDDWSGPKIKCEPISAAIYLADDFFSLLNEIA